MVTTMLIALAGLLTPWPLKILVDNVLQNQPLTPILARPLGWLARDRFGLLMFAVLAGLAITLMENGLRVLGSYVNTRLELGMALEFRSDLFQHAQRLSLAYHDQSRSGMVI